MTRLAISAALALAGVGPAPAEPGCRLALVLALDVSSSVDAVEYRLQRAGLAAALDTPEVRHAILSGAPGTVALAVYEWSGFQQQALQLDWTLLHDAAAIDRAVALLAGMRRSHDEFPTSIGAALGYGATLLRHGPDCDRRVIDISGDGMNNFQFGPQEAYRHFPFDGVTVNGLVILGEDPSIRAYYAEEILFGPGAFLEVARGFRDFRRAMTRKLFREVNDIMLGTAPGAAGAAGAKPRG